MTKLISFFIILSLLICCKEKVHPVEIINFDSMRLNPSDGITVKQSKEQGIKFNNLHRTNTLNRRLHKMNVFNINNEKITLNNQFKNQKCLLLIGTSTCSSCKVGFFENMPLIIDSLKNLNKNPKVISLIIKYPYDTIKTERFNNYLEASIKHYPIDTYIIDEVEVLKLNVFTYPLFYFIDENEIIKHIEIGASINGIDEKFKKVYAFF